METTETVTPERDVQPVSQDDNGRQSTENNNTPQTEEDLQTRLEKLERSLNNKKEEAARVHTNYEELRKKLNEYETKETELREAEMKKKGEYEELLKSRDAELSTLKSQLEEFTSKVNVYEESYKSQLDEVIKTLPDDLREVVEAIPEGDIAKRLNVAKKLSTTIVKTTPTPPSTHTGATRTQGGVLDLIASAKVKK